MTSRPPKTDRLDTIDLVKKIVVSLRGHGLSYDDILPFTLLKSTQSIQKWAAGLSGTHQGNLERIVVAHDLASATVEALGGDHQLGHIAVLFATPHSVSDDQPPSEFIKIHGEAARSKLQGLPQSFTEAVKAGRVVLPESLAGGRKKTVKSPKQIELEIRNQALAEAKKNAHASTVRSIDRLIRYGLSFYDIDRLIYVLGAPELQAIKLHSGALTEISDLADFKLHKAAQAADIVARTTRRGDVSYQLQTHLSCLGGKSILEAITAINGSKLNRCRLANRVIVALQGSTR